MSTKGQQKLWFFGGVLLVLGLCVGAAWVLVNGRNQTTASTDTVVKAGHTGDFPLQSVTQLLLPVTFWDPDPAAVLGSTPGIVTQPATAAVNPVPVWLVHNAQTEFLALYARDPYLGCQVVWEEVNQRFVNPCHGQKYTMTGDVIEGPSERGLDRFAVVVNEVGEVWVDVGRFQEGDWVASAVIFTETAVSTTPIPTAPPQTVEVTVEVLPPQPSATPAPCTPLDGGMRVEIVPESETVVTMRLAGFQPGEALIIQFTGSAKDETAQIEWIPAAAVLPDGEFQTYTFDLGIYEAITAWQGKVIHSRGAACFDILLPLSTDPIIFEAVSLEPSE